MADEPHLRLARVASQPARLLASLVALGQDPASSCVHARDLAQEHLVAVRAKLAELKGLERSILSSRAQPLS